jgi:agmatine deiminase
MKSILTCFAIALFIISCSSPKEKDDLLVVNQRAEFEAQEAIWFI